MIDNTLIHPAGEVIDNFEVIKPILDFNSDDDFYFVQILERKKEHPELGSNSRVLKTYYIKNIGHLNYLYDEIRTLCIVFNARAYVHPTKRSFERITYQTLKMVTDYIIQPDFSPAHRSWDSACGKYATGKDKRWIVDVDNGCCEDDEETIRNYINGIFPATDDRILLKVPTKNGYHLITKPFNLMEFKKQYPSIDVHKNNPTLLFAMKKFEK